ncbi:MAG TPA: TolC family protein [Candidatus Hydrogenedentes bacterium]|nr:TolC family protein [Candidatus Hydrogenedentota bacterium]
MKILTMVAAAVLLLAGGSLAQEEIITLTAAEVVGRVLKIHPGIQEALEAVEEARGHALQEGLWPNPELEAGAEGLHGNRGGDWLAGVSQRIPLFGARALARKAAEAGVAAAGQQALLREKELTALAEMAFYEALAAQESRRIAENNLANAAAMAEMTRQRFEAGDIAEMDWLRAAAEENHQEAELEVLRIREETALAALTVLCALPPGAKPVLEGTLLPEEQAFPDAAVVAERLGSAPAARALELEAEAAAGEVKALKREALPEPEVHVGWRQERAEKQNAVDFSVSFDLPLFDRNQGAIAGARARARRLEAARQAKVQEDCRQALTLLGEGKAALKEAQLVREKNFPKLEGACRALETALTLGGVSLFEVLAAQQEVAEMRMHLLDLDHRARHALIELEALF